MRKILSIATILAAISVLMVFGKYNPAVEASFNEIWQVDKSKLALSDSLFNSGMQAFEAKEYPEAARLFNESMEIDTVIFHPDNYRNGYSRHWLAETLRQMGDEKGYEKYIGGSAGKPIDRALTLKADSLSLLGICWYETDPAESSRLLKECVVIEREVYGPTHPMFSNSMMILGNALISSGKPKEAADTLRKALEIRRNFYGEDNLEYANALSTLALALHFTEEFDKLKEGVALRDQALKIFSDQEDHDNVAFESYYLANDLLSLGVEATDFEEREAYLQRGLNYLSAAEGVTDLSELYGSYFRSLGNLYSGVVVNNNLIHVNPQEAVRLDELALNYYKETEKYGIDPLVIPATYLRLGQAFQAMYDYLNAEEYINRSIDLMRQIQGSDRLNIIYPLQSLASQYAQLNQNEKALEILQEALDVMNQSEVNIDSDKLVVLTAMANTYGKVGDYIRAKECLDQVYAINEKNIDKHSPDWVMFYNFRIPVNRALGNELLCLQDHQTKIELCKEIYPDDLERLAGYVEDFLRDQINYGVSEWEDTYKLHEDILLSMDSVAPYKWAKHYYYGANGYLYNSKYDKANELIDKSIEIYAPVATADNDNSLIDFYLKKAEIAMQAKHYDKALENCQAIYKMSDNLSNYTLDQVNSLEAKIYAELNQFDKAIEKGEAATDYRKADYEENSSSYLDGLSTLSSYYSSNREFEKAFQLRQEIANKYLEMFGSDSKPYLEALVDLWKTPVYGDGQKQIDTELSLIEKIKEDQGENSLTYNTALLKAADTFSNLGLYQEALEFGEKGLVNYREIVGEQHESYQGALVSSIGWYFNTRDFDKALERANLAIELTDTYHPNSVQRQKNAMQWKEATYDQMLDFGSALYEADQMLNVIKEYFGESSREYLDALLSKGSALLKAGDKEGSLVVSKELIEKAEKFPDKYTKDLYVLNGHNGILLSLMSQGDIDGVRQELTEIEKIYQKEDEVMTHNLAYAYFMIGDTDKALELSDEILNSKFFKNVKDVNKANIYVKQGIVQAFSGRPEEGKQLMERGMEMRDSIFNGQGHFVLLGLRDMLTLSDSLGDVEAKNRYALRLNDVTADYVRQSFLTMPAQTREKQWAQYSPFIMDEFPALALETPSDEMLSAAYDNILLGKGLLLNTQREIVDILSGVDDPEARQKFEEYKLNRAYLDNLSSLDASRVTLNVDSLEQATRKLEYEMMAYCGDFTASMSTKTADVARSLRPGEVAIEFTTIQNDPSRYMALVLEKDAAAPKMVAFDDLIIGQIWRRSPQKLSQELWQPLAEVIGDAKDVYFAAAGDLHSYPVETLPDFENEDKLINERWNLRRLSSTRELTKRGNKRDIASAAIYGGLVYEADTAVLASAERGRALRNANGNANRDFQLVFEEFGDSTLRAGAQYLPASLDEAVSIRESLANKGISSQMFTDTIGTETSFKELSGKGVNLLHVATHGFTLSPKDVPTLSNAKFLHINDDQVMSGEDNALSMSGLLFTGANHALRGEEIPEGVDDGVLLAKEIAALDLSDMDLIIMSACETGLGPVTGEGVFGLQRGFKKAGANSIMMSLWKVNDKATQLLMTAFYDNFLKGMSKQEALAAAQKAVREYQEERDSVTINPYQNPRYWAAFILLDALD